MKHRFRGASTKQLLAFARGAKAAAQRAKANVQADMDRAELRAIEEETEEEFEARCDAALRSSELWD